MGGAVNLEDVDLMKLARSIERACQEGIKWERRRLQWILDEQKSQADASESKQA